MWIATQELPRSASHPFYKRLNRVLEQNGFDEYVEQLCESFYAPTMGRPSLAPGMYFGLLMLGYFEGIDSERGIAWRAADSLSVREFLGLELDEGCPDHSTISRTRRLIDVETHRAVFSWILDRLAAGFNMRRQRSPQGKQSNVRNQTINVRKEGARPSRAPNVVRTVAPLNTLSRLAILGVLVHPGLQC